MFRRTFQKGSRQLSRLSSTTVEKKEKQPGVALKVLKNVVLSMFALSVAYSAMNDDSVLNLLDGVGVRSPLFVLKIESINDRYESYKNSFNRASKKNSLMNFFDGKSSSDELTLLKVTDHKTNRNFNYV